MNRFFPCEYIRKFNVEDNFVLMDFFYGVPLCIYGRSIFRVEKLTGNVTYVSWRNKLTAWHDSYFDLLIRKKFL